MWQMMVNHGGPLTDIIAESENNEGNLIFKPLKPQLPFCFNKAIKQLSQLGIPVYAADAAQYDPAVFTCGGTGERKDVHKNGQFKIQVETECPLFKGLETLQMFHDLTENGRKMLHNFLFDICGLQRGFTLEKREQQCNDYIRRTVKRDHAEERLLLEELSSHSQYVATLLPIRTVGVQVFVIMANGLSRIPTTMAPAPLRLAQKANATVATSTGSQHQTLTVAVINRSHVGLAGEVSISSLRNRLETIL
ncbi:hypothetical protein OUZ56_019310 [Daphnia magna]|uniref:Uncharacterized protein n=1 Tax=Daphnia magna TaxID=35525 RepID=A0ABQ9ZBV2_9CRUS|nr:hypothetical protein OUZ56_019310 [Daphnia magna]